MGLQRRGLNWGAAAMAAALAACSPQAATDAGESTGESKPAVATHPDSGLELIPVTVTTQAGEHEFTTEVASTAQEQARGLMFRTELGPDEAMIFPREGDVASFWMKNTPLPLDIIFIGTDGRILNIAAITTPYSLDSVVSAGVASAVLELNGGRAEELGIEAGDQVEW